MSVFADIIEERSRQILVEGWTPEHDDTHADNSLSKAAACYAVGSLIPGVWPWGLRFWKPKNRRRDLIRAAALIVAEIERLDRASGKEAARDEPKDTTKERADG
jgi:hypothetical protein